MSRRDGRALKQAQRTIGANLTDDRYVRPGTIVTDRRGQRWVGMVMQYQRARAQMWWREVDAQRVQTAGTKHLETALDGKRIDHLVTLCGPLTIESIPRRILGIF